MIPQHPAKCTCKCHVDPGEAKLRIVNLQGDDPALRWHFSRAVLVGFTNPMGLRCMACGQYYGYEPGTGKLRPITGDQAYGPHPDIASSWFAPVTRFGWWVANWLTPASAPVELQEKIRDGLHPPTWEFVNRWTMV